MRQVFSRKRTAETKGPTSCEFGSEKLQRDSEADISYIDVQVLVRDWHCSVCGMLGACIWGVCG